MSNEALIGITLVLGLYMAWNIGANDVANAFGMSVGSGALTFRRALILAAIFEFAGAFFVGANVANTIKGEIISPQLFAPQPRELAIGMIAALLGASLWLNLATYLSQPVSTTHAIIGAVIGVGILSHGMGCVQWHKMGEISASWVISPVCGGFMAFLLYKCIRKFLLGAPRPAERARTLLPFAYGAVTGIIVFSIVRQSGGRLLPGMDAASVRHLGTIVTLAAAAGAMLLARAIIRRRCRVADGADPYEAIERWFMRLQIMTACYMSFAHGANDVANAIGPLCGVLQAIQGNVVQATVVPSWVLFMGAVGIVVGLATYGYKVITNLGKNITEVTPTRGFSADFSTASTVLVCSIMGLPISTTFVIVGAVMGVGFARGFGAIDLGVVRKIFASWLVTIPVSAVLAGIIYWVVVRLGL